MNNGANNKTGAAFPGLAVSPLQLQTLGDLCATYKKTKATIKKWHQEGAPINFDGVTYSADYHLMEVWRLKRFSNFADF